MLVISSLGMTGHSVIGGRCYLGTALCRSGAYGINRFSIRLEFTVYRSQPRRSILLGIRVFAPIPFHRLGDVPD